MEYNRPLRVPEAVPNAFELFCELLYKTTPDTAFRHGVLGRIELNQELPALKPEAVARHSAIELGSIVLVGWSP